MASWKVDGKNVTAVDMYEGRNTGAAVEFRAWQVSGPNKESRKEIPCDDLDAARKLVASGNRVLVYAITRSGAQVLVTARSLKVWDDMVNKEIEDMEEEKREDAVDQAALAQPEYKSLVILENGALLKFPKLSDALTHRDVPTSAVVWGRASSFVADATMEEALELAKQNLPDRQFDSSPEGKRSIYYALLEIARTPQERVTQAAGGDTEDGDMAGKKGAAKKATAKKASGERKARTPKNSESKIKVLAEENPKRKGTASHARFAKYKDGMTVDEFIKKGGTAADVNYDVKHGYISLS
jgi:hypothetical protein